MFFWIKRIIKLHVPHDICLISQNNIKAKAESKQTYIWQKCATLCVFWVYSNAQMQHEWFDLEFWNVPIVSVTA